MSASGLVDNWWEWVTALSWQLALLILLIAMLSRALPRKAAQLRHALWLLVLVKVFLPPGLTAPWSVGQWAVRPAITSLSIAPFEAGGPADPLPQDGTESGVVQRPERALPSVVDSGQVSGTTRKASSSVSIKDVACLVWIGGVLMLGLLVAVQWMQLQRRLKSATVVEEGPLRVALEQTALDLGLSSTPELVLVDGIPSPFLVGVIRPRIVLPARMAGMTAQQLSPVLAHELAHWQRWDAWIGCLQAAVQVLLWFHPFLWWANSQLRQERECACDDEVLQKTRLTPAEYGESLVHCLMTSRGERLATGHVLGVLEQGTNLQTRLEQIMAHRKSRRSFGLMSSAVIAGCAVLLFPMAVHPPASAADSSAAPKIVSIEPANGATDVDPAINALKVTFDKPMGGGMSWVGGGEAFPTIPEGKKGQWSKDRKTCSLPVTLVPDHAYSLGLNSSKFQNFKSASGVPLEPVRYTFTTGKLAGEASKPAPQESTGAAVPKIVSIEPANGAEDVDPALKELKVTFDIAMSGGMSWTGSGPTFPTVPEGQRGQWSEDKKTCTLPVQLVADHVYALGLNSRSFKNFKSAAGVSLEPVLYKFTTRKAAGDSTGAPTSPSATSLAPPKPAPLDLDAAAAELSSKYGKAHPEVQEFVLQTMRSFGRSGLWLNENAYSALKPAERDARVAYLAKLFEDSVYGRHLCSGLAEASALKDPKLLPGLKKVAAYHVDGQNYDCRAKWMAVAALARQESPDAVPTLVSLVDHGNQNTRFWARAALARMAEDDFKDDKQAWNKWWVGQGHEAIDAAFLKPYVPPTQK